MKTHGSVVGLSRPGGRRSVRLATHDYSAAGVYFVTVCTAERVPLLGSVRNGRMHQSSAGTVVVEVWHRAPHVWPFVRLDAFVVMPDHVHGLVVLTRPGVIGLGTVVQQFKGAVTKHLRLSGIVGTKAVWQRSYHERVVRTRRELEYVRRYIHDNPARWTGG